jgi:hypothetical protein
MSSIVERVKEVAGRKKADLEEAGAREVRYQAYKRPELSYIATGQKTTDYEESTEFAERKQREDEQAAERRARKREQVEAAKQKAMEAVREGGQNLARKLKEQKPPVLRKGRRVTRRAPSSAKRIIIEHRMPGAVKKTRRMKPKPRPQEFGGWFDTPQGHGLTDPLGFRSTGKNKSSGFDVLGFGPAKKTSKKRTSSDWLF